MSKFIKPIFLSLALFITSAQVFANETHEGTSNNATEDKHSTASIGKPGSAKKVTRTISLTQNDDMRFSMKDIEVKAGETIRFNIQNKGGMRHEFVLGTEQGLKDHGQMMIKMPNMVHHATNLVSIPAGKRDHLIWTFTNPGVVMFGCLQPGHFGAGMNGKIVVK